MSRIDAMFVDGQRVKQTFNVRVENDRDADPETGEGEWNVHFEGEWISTWTTRAEAEEHARRINAALEWSGEDRKPGEGEM